MNVNALILLSCFVLVSNESDFVSNPLDRAKLDTVSQTAKLDTNKANKKSPKCLSLKAL